MRLISLLSFFFVSYAYTYARASNTLDLDNYDPEEVNLTVDSKQFFDVETFTPKDGSGFVLVSDSGGVVWTDTEGAESATKATVYSVKVVPQLLELELSKGNTLFFKLESNRFVQLEEKRFDQLKRQLADSTFHASLVFAANVAKNFSTRQFYTVEDKLNDGVQNKVFTPTGTSAALTQVNDEDLTVFKAPVGSKVTKVVVSLNNGNPALLEVENQVNNNNVSHYFQKANFRWNEVDYSKYKEVLNSLTPQDVTKQLTLDLSNPDEDHYEVVKELDSGVSKTTFRPKATYLLNSVNDGGDQLWSSNVEKATEVVAVKQLNTFVLVKVTTKNQDGNETDVNLEKTDEGYQPVTDQAFSQKLANLQQGSHSHSENQQVSVDLDVLAPNDNFVVKKGTFKGVLVNVVVPKHNVYVKNVLYSTHTVFDSLTEQVTAVYVYFANNQPKVVEVRSLGPHNEHIYDRKDFEDGVWLSLLPHYFQQFLSESVAQTNASTPVDLDLAQPDENVVTEESSALFGVESTALHAKDNYFFKTVNYNGVQVNSPETNGATLVKATSYYENVNGGLVTKLVQLEGYDNGESKSFYYNFNGSTFTSLNEQAFNNQFNNLRPRVKPTSPSFPSAPEPEESVPFTAPQEEETTPEPSQFQLVNLDTTHPNRNVVNLVQGETNGYHFHQYTPKQGFLFGTVDGPRDFHFNGRNQLGSSFLKFYFVHADLVGARLDTVKANDGTRHLTYYYTFQNNEWNQSATLKELEQLLYEKLAYTQESKESLDRLRRAEQEYSDTLRKLDESKREELEKQRKKEEEEDHKVRPQLSRKTRLYEDMVDFDKQLEPEPTKPVYPTKEEVEERKQPYATGQDFYVEPDLVYLDIFQPAKNKRVHVKTYNCMGMPVVDVTPYGGKTVHVLELHGKRLWVGTKDRKCTNLQLFYEDNSVVGAVLRVTKRERSKLRAGDEFDYLFVKDGELKQVELNDFYKLSLPRFEREALGRVSRPGP